MLQDPLCDKECLSLCLSYFPSKMGVQKCGCMSAYERSLTASRQAGPKVEKFFNNPEDESDISNIEEQTRLQYENRLREIDLEILNLGLSNQGAPAVSMLAKTSANDKKNDNSTDLPPKKNTSESVNKTTSTLKHPEDKKNPEHHFCKDNDE